MTLEKTLKNFEKHSECIQQTLISKEEAEAVYEWLKELKRYRDGLDKIDILITEAIDKSTNQVECQTLRWVLDILSSEVVINANSY